MKTYLDCYPCFLRQALDAARMAGLCDKEQKALLDRVLDRMQHIELSSTPPEIGAEVHRLVRQEADNDDPYREAKEASTRQAQNLLPRLREMLRQADDPWELALRLSIAGNIIDLGPNRHYDLWPTIERVVHQPFAIDDRAALNCALAQASSVLYLADNAGETVFDRVLIEAIDVPVVYATKGGPIINDATREDALAVGLDRVATIIDNGSQAPGTVLQDCSPEFQQLFDEATVVIAKGQANYETLSDKGPKCFFLLQTKCPVIASDVGVPVRSAVLKQG